MLVMMFLFDWRMGAACLLAAVISVIAMFSMMGGKNAKLMAEYQAAQDRMTKAGTEYVRGIPVVKIFQQTFNLPVTGIVDYATWYKISAVYVGVTKIAELRNDLDLLEKILCYTECYILNRG